jgi:hypothetical protein
VLAVADNTVAIVGLAVGGIVGIAGPIIVSVFAARRTREELKSSDERQRRAIRHAGEREVLDAGAVLLQRLRMITGTPLGTPGRGDSKDMVIELGAHLSRLLLWFPEDSEIAQSFQAMLALCIVFENNEFEMRRTKNTDGIKKLENEIQAARKRYLDAARERLAEV